MTARILNSVCLGLALALLWAWPAHAQSPNCPLVSPISQTASAKVVSGVAGQKISICSLVLVSASQQQISLAEGTGSACGSSTVALLGATSASMAFPAGGILAVPSLFPILRTAVAGDDLCVLQSGNGNVSGTLTYTLSP